MTHKLIYLARRNPNIMPEDFGEVWRSHSRLASTLGANFGRNFTRVRQCIKVYEAKVPPEYVNEHDGAALLTMVSWEALRSARSHPDALTTMRNDELRVFAEHAANFTMATEEILHIGGSEGTAALLSFVRRRAGVTQAEFDAAWPAHAEEVFALDAARGASTRALNKVVEAPGPRYDFAGISEVWFPDVATALSSAWDTKRRAAITKLDEIVDPAASVSLLVRINFEKIPTV